MEVILRENIDGLGREGDLIRVADGYARNYLIPKGFALVANEKNRRILEHEKQIEAMRLTKEQRKAEVVRDRLADVTLVIQRLAGENNRLFGSVTAIDIGEALQQRGFDLDRRRIELDEPIRELGTFPVSIRLHPEVTATITVKVVASEIP